MTSTGLVPVFTLNFSSGPGVAPYKAVLTHGFIVDAEGRKMSKSIGNTVAPEIIGRYGADVLRLWAASADYRADIRVSPKILEQMSDVLGGSQYHPVHAGQSS